MSLKVKALAIETLKPNDYNPNVMTEAVFQFLINQIKTKGFRQPILINKDLVIIDGEHRWRAAQQLELKKVPCIVIEEERDERMISTIAMNKTRGDMNPLQLAECIHELHKKYTLEDLEKLLGYEKPQLTDSLNLLKIPADLEQRIKEQAAEEERTLPKIITFILAPTQIELLESALQKTNEEKRDAQLIKVVEIFLESEFALTFTDDGGAESE